VTSSGARRSSNPADFELQMRTLRRRSRVVTPAEVAPAVEPTGPASRTTLEHAAAVSRDASRASSCGHDAFDPSRGDPSPPSSKTTLSACSPPARWHPRRRLHGEPPSSIRRADTLCAGTRRHPKDRWLLVGTGAESTRQAIALTRAAAAAGADAVLVRRRLLHADARAAQLGDYYRAIATPARFRYWSTTFPSTPHRGAAEVLLDLARTSASLGEGFLGRPKNSLRTAPPCRNGRSWWDPIAALPALELAATAVWSAWPACRGRCVELYAAFRAATRPAPRRCRTASARSTSRSSARSAGGIKAAMDAVACTAARRARRSLPWHRDRERVARLVVA